MTVPNWLSDEALLEANQLLGLPESALAALLEAAATARRHDGLLRLLMECTESAELGPDEEWSGKLIRGLPALVDGHNDMIKNVMRHMAGMFPVLVVAGLLPWTVRYYEHKGIPEEVLSGTMGDLLIWMKHYKAAYEYWGLDNLTWLLNHISGRLFRVGRLQYMFKRSDLKVIVVRNRLSGSTLLLSEAGVRYRGDGLIDGTNGVFDAQRSWTAGFHQDDGALAGYPLLATGVATTSLVRLPASEWQVVFRPGDGALDMHIPEGEPLRPEMCTDSMKRAASFFSRHFPGKRVHAFVCVSWLLDSQLSDILPVTSNITAFQKLLQLFPVLSDESEAYSRVFGTKTVDPASAPRDTALRRAIVDYVASGGMLRGGGGLRLLSTDY